MTGDEAGWPEACIKSFSEDPGGEHDEYSF